MAPQTKASPLVRKLYALIRDRSLADRSYVYAALAALSDAPRAPGLRDPAVNALLECADDLGVVPSRRRYDSWRACSPREWPSSTSIRDAFGGWPAALASAGLQPRPNVEARALLARGKEFSEEALIEALRLCAEDLDTSAISQSRYKEWARGREPGEVPRVPDTFERHFGSWVSALREAGLDAGTEIPRPTPRHAMTKEEIVNTLAEALDVIGYHELTTRTYSIWRRERMTDPAWADRALPSIATIQGRLGGWRSGLAMAHEASRRFHQGDLDHE